MSNVKITNLEIKTSLHVSIKKWNHFNYETLVHVVLEMVGVEPESELYEALMVVHDDIIDTSFSPRFDGLNMGESENGSRMYPKIHMIYNVETSTQKAFLMEMVDAIGEGTNGYN